METRHAKARRCGGAAEGKHVEPAKQMEEPEGEALPELLDAITMEPIGRGMEVRLGPSGSVCASTLLQAALRDPHGPRNPFTRELLSDKIIAVADAAVAASKWTVPVSGADRAYARALTGSWSDDATPTTLREAGAWAKQRAEHRDRGLVMCSRIGAIVAYNFDNLQATCHVSEPPDRLLRVARVLCMAFQCGTEVRSRVSAPLLYLLRREVQANRMHHTIYARGSNLALACLRSAMARGALQATQAAQRAGRPVVIEPETLAACADQMSAR